MWIEFHKKTVHSMGVQNENKTKKVYKMETKKIRNKMNSCLLNKKYVEVGMGRL